MTIVVHADPDLLGRRLQDHPPVHAATDDGLTTSDNPTKINCAWCRRTLGILDETPLPDDEKPKVREWTIVTCIDGSFDEVTVDADRFELNVDPVSIAFLRDDQPVFGAPLSRIAYWYTEDMAVEKDAPAS